MSKQSGSAYGIVAARSFLPLMFVLFAGVEAVAAVTDAPANQPLIQALRQGGYVLFLRHPQSHQDQADTDPLHLDNVAAQRQLTDAG